MIDLYIKCHAGMRMNKFACEMGVSYKGNVSKKKPDTEEPILFDSIYINTLICVMKINVTFEGREEWEKAQDRAIFRFPI